MALTTETQIGEGTKRLAEWACKTFFPTEQIKNLVSGKMIDVWERSCLSDPWFISIMSDCCNPEQWAVYADYLEDRGDPRAADVRVCARLLPLDVFPDETPHMFDEMRISGWWIHHTDKPSYTDIERLGFDWIYPKELTGSTKSVITALRALDSAIQAKALDTALQGER